VRSARAGIGAGEAALAREAQLLVGYPDSPIVGQHIADGALADGPIAGQRAPDASGLAQDTVGYPIRVHDLLRHNSHTLLLWAGDPGMVETQRELAEQIHQQLADHLRSHVIVAASASLADASGLVFRDANGGFAGAYATGDTEAAAHLIRPDGYVGFRTSKPTADGLLAHLRHVVRW
jgi:hypothetical protein